MARELMLLGMENGKLAGIGTGCLGNISRSAKTDEARRQFRECTNQLCLATGDSYRECLEVTDRMFEILTQGAETQARINAMGC